LKKICRFKLRTLRKAAGLIVATVILTSRTTSSYALVCWYLVITAIQCLSSLDSRKQGDKIEFASIFQLFGCHYVFWSGKRQISMKCSILQIHEAYERMMGGKAHFRVVVDWEAK
jgi:D-arabinose 1-dehydrogenase-like Zn-dependent alcohol dehydrogenase